MLLSIVTNKTYRRLLMKKITTVAVAALASLALFTGCKEKSTGLKIGISKTVQHPALDAIEQGIQDELKNQGVEATFDLQNANGDVATAAQIANLFKSENVDLSVGIGTPVAVALATAIKDNPVVFSCVTDPVSAGLVETLDKGNGNVTGLSDAIPTVDQIALFAKIANLKTLGYIYTSSEANSVSSLELVKEGCDKAGIALITQSITNSSELKQAAEAIVGSVDGFYLTTDNTVFSALASLVSVCNREKKPIFSGDVTGAMDGGCFMAMGFNYYKAGLATGRMIKEILDGKKPADMPVMLITDPADSDLLIDLDAAANCGITLPEEYVANANYIFQNGALEEK